MQLRVLGLIAAAICVMAPGAGPVYAQMRAVPIASGLSQPLDFVADPTDATRLFIVEKGGRIRVIVSGSLRAVPFLDLSAVVIVDGERGLLGLAFAPDYAVSRRLFVNFTNRGGHTVIARFLRRAETPLEADPSTRFDLKWSGLADQGFINQPFSNHNGGKLAFGPGGYLYIALGDGGSGGDPGNRAQNLNSYLGKMLRIDVRVADAHARGYQVPAGNPFVGGGGLPEIWSIGWRNPWKFSFDDVRGGTGALWVGDVGQSRFEEISYEPPATAGRNYGWRNREGLVVYDDSVPPAYLPLVDPALALDRGLAQSITGGYRYRGAAVAALQGRYVFGDFITGRVWSAAVSMTGQEATLVDVINHTADLGGALGNISSFGRDLDGELYIVSYGGTVYRIEAGCGTGVTPSPVLFPAAGGRVSIAVSTGTSCAWSLSALPSWVSASVTSGTGPTTVALDAAVSSAAAGRSATVMVGTAALTLRQGGTVSAAGDVNADGVPDLIWRNTVSGDLAVWQMNDRVLLDSLSLVPGQVADLNWAVVAVGDLDRNGSPDLVWWRAATSEIAVWFMQGRMLLSSESIGSGRVGDPGWQPVAAGDVDADGWIDVIWRHATSGDVAVWLLQGASLRASEAFLPGRVPDPDWRIVAAVDLDGSGTADLLWRHATTGDLAVWYLS